jgi:hypothetical protein
MAHEVCLVTYACRGDSVAILKNEKPPRRTADSFS